MTSAEDPFTPIANGTGPFKLDYWTPGTEVSLVRNEEYWGGPATLKQVLIKEVAEFGTRFAMLEAGDADAIVVPAEYRTQVDPLVSVARVYDAATNTYLPEKSVCTIDTDKLGLDRFELCDTANDNPLRLYIGRPGLQQDVILFNFLIQ